MKMKLMVWLTAALLLGTGTLAQAATNCSISSPGINTSYEGAAVTAQSSFAINCTRLAADPGSAAYNLRPDNGLWAQGQNNRAAFGANRLAYAQFKDSSCSASWTSGGNANNAIAGTVTFIGTSLTATVNGSFWVCINGGLSYVAGIYTDTVTMTLLYNNDGANNKLNGTATGSYPITINTEASCTISSPPGNLNFNYTAFQAAASTASASFSTTCTAALGYSMSVAAAGGVASGVNYGLSLNTTASGGSMPLGSVGTGTVQTFFINGSAPAGQAGSCGTGGCVASQSHSLVITF